MLKRLIFFILSSSASATTVLPLGVDDLVGRSPVVIYGRVAQIQVDSGTGERTAVVESLDVAKSPEEFKHQRDFYVPLLNRALPGRLMERVAGAPELRPDEELVLFLRPVDVDREGLHRRRDGQRIFALEGFHQGKLRVVHDATGARRLLTWDLAPEGALSATQLRAQSTTPRTTGLRPQSVPTGVPVESLRTLDSVLNAARAAGGAR
ncbi:MAG: hypothetical protein JST16_13630 [Bdellovibrionales bacterium]|nr:hypothetical protein [Bdellovibrionales bacterium]